MFKQNKNWKKILVLMMIISIFFVLSASNVFASETDTTNLVAPNWWSLLSDPGNFILQIVTFLINLAIFLLGSLLILVMEALVYVSSYNNFINVTFVTMGWTMLRDVVNMFFILGLLFIAFVTVLNIQKYQWNKLLFRLLLMAILVNFSKTILGLIIDAFQVIMITFVNAYKGIGRESLFQILGIPQYTAFSDVTKGTAQNLLGKGEQDVLNAIEIAGSTALAIVFILISLVVISIFLIILMFRIVALWLLVVISPLAFFAWAFEGMGPGLGKISTQFWSKLWHYCSIGPALAFFLWLSLAAMVKFDATSEFSLTAGGGSEVAVGLSGAGTLAFFMKYLIGILTLVGGLVMANQFQVIGASYAGGAANWMKKQTAGRVENYARRAGAAAAGAGAYVAAAPGKMAKPYIEGLTAGASQRLQAGRFTKLLTKPGRERTAAAMRAGAESLILTGREGTAELRAAEAKNAEGYKKAKQGVNWDNPDEVRQKVLDVELAKTPINRDKSALEAAYTALADKGKFSYKDLNEMNKKGGFLDGKGRRNKQMFLEDMEKRIEKETGRHKSLSSLIYNEDTNEYEDVSDLEKFSKDALTGVSDDLKHKISNIDVGKITTKENGRYVLKGIDKDGNIEKGSEFEKLDADVQKFLIDQQKNGNDKDSNFSRILRSQEVRTSRRKEVQKGIGTANQERFNKAAKQPDLLDIARNPIDYAIAESRGILQQIPRIGSLDQPGRDNMKAKMQFMFGTNEERAKIIDKNKNLFDESFHGKTAEQLAQMKDENGKNLMENLDLHVKDFSLEDLEKYQEAMKESSAKFNTLGQKLEEGTGFASLDNKVNDARVSGGVRSKLAQTINKTLPADLQGQKFSALEFVDTGAERELAATSDFNKEDRIEQVTNWISRSDKSGLKGKNDVAREIAKKLIDLEKEVRDRSKVMADKQKDFSKKISFAIAEASDKFQSDERGPEDIEELKHYLQTIITGFEKDIESSALNTDSFALDSVKKQMEKLYEALQNKSITQKEFNEQIKGLRSSLRDIGYNTSK